MLHWVALCGSDLQLENIAPATALLPQHTAMRLELMQQCFGLLPGFHRISLDHGHVLLTLCVGARQAMLRQQAFDADAVVIACADGTADCTDARSHHSTGNQPAHAQWSIWDVKALARCCRRGTRLTLLAPAQELIALLQSQGFMVDDAPATVNELPHRTATFAPAWRIGRSRRAAAIAHCAFTAEETPASGSHHHVNAPTCAVVGAGLGGAGVAASLARRGFTVTVLDSGGTPASQASGLPAGVLAPQVSRDDNQRSSLSRAGVRMTLRTAEQFLGTGQDFAPTGVLERQFDAERRLPDIWSQAGLEWSRPAVATDFEGIESSGMCPSPTGVWHLKAGWIKPAALVRTWLSQPGVNFRGLADVRRIARSEGQWVLIDPQGCELLRTDLLVLASAMGTVSLLESLGVQTRPELNAVHGQISWGVMSDTLPTFTGGPPIARISYPVNGAGSFIPRVPTPQGTAWFAGASYEPAEVAQTGNGAVHIEPFEPDLNVIHRENFMRLQALCPSASKSLADAFSAAGSNATGLQRWRNTRCVSRDRMPLVGPLQIDEHAATLWLCTAMGSRGLTYAALAGELIAAQMCGEPLPIEARHLKLFSPARF